MTVNKLGDTLCHTRQMRNECNILLELSEEGSPLGKLRYPGGRTIK